MNPIAPLTYYRRHKADAALLVVIVTLVTLALGAMVSVLDAYMENMYLDIAYLGAVSAVYPAVRGELDPTISAQLRTHPDVERIIPESGMSINHPQLVGTNWLRLFVIPVADMPDLLRASGLRVAAGRLPAANTAELALSSDTARTLDLRLGDRLSRATNSEFYGNIASEVTVVGLLDQDPAAAARNVRLGLMSYEYIMGHANYMPRSTGLLVIPRPGRLAALNRFLNTLPESMAGSETQDYWNAEIARIDASLRLTFTIVDLLVAGAVALVVSVINQIAISRRLAEFGLLLSLGWRKEALLGRVTGGTAGVAMLGWLAGLAGMVALVSLGRETYFAAHGQEWSLSFAPFLYTLPIPLTVTIFTAGSVWQVFRRLDAVAIIERGKLSLEETDGRKQPRRASPNPLSSRTFYLRHRRRGLLLVGAMALMILGVAFPVFILLPIFDAQLPRIAYLRYVSEVLPGAGRELDPAVIARIRAHSGVARIIPVWEPFLSISVPPFSQTGTSLLAVTEDDMRYLLERFGLRLVAGRLPQPRTNEVVISEALALNRGLRLGDSVGNPVYGRDSFPVELTVVGLLETKDMWTGFASLEYLQNHELTAGSFLTSLLVVAAEDQPALDAWLQANTDARTAVVLTYAGEVQRLQKYRVGGLTVLAAILALVALIAAAALAVLNYIFFIQRREEFGTLCALGRSHGWLVWRAGREALFTTTIAWLVGAGLCLGLMAYLQLAVYAPRGLSMDLTTTSPWLFTLPIPLAVFAASTGAIGWVIQRLDPVAVIEGR